MNEFSKGGLYTIKILNENKKVKGMYVGITNNFNTRKRQHIYNSKRDNNSLLYNKMRTYNYIINLEFEISDRELLNEMEIYYISEVRKLSNHIECYNISTGGEGVNGVGSELDMYSLNGEYIMSFSTGIEASRYLGVKNTSSIFNCALGKDNVSAYGYIWRYKGDSIYKFGDIFNEKYIGRSCTKIVYRYDLNGVFIDKYANCMEAERKTGILNTSISRVCNGKQRTTSDGSVWRYEGDDFNKYSIKNSCCTPVDKYDLNGVFIRTYDSIIEAQIDTIGHNCFSQNIEKCCKGKRKTCGGFIWRYSGDPFELYPTDKKKKIRKVVMLSLDEEILNIFSSGKEAERITGISQSSISACCLGKVKTAGGYKWKYIEN